MPSRLALRRSGRLLPLAVLPLLALAVVRVGPAAAADTAPAPRLVSAARDFTPADLDKLILEEIKARSEIMKNLEFISDTIGPRLTGSRNLERANQWTEAKMKEYGLENVRLEPWEIPVGWERGTASLRVVEPDTRVNCPVAAVGWTPGLEGKVTGEVMVLNVRTRADLDKYKGKLKNAILLSGPPAFVAPITDMSYGRLPGPPKKDEPKKGDPKKEEPKKEEPKKGEAKKIDAGSISAEIGGQPPEKKEAKDEGKKEEAKKDQPPAPKKDAPPAGVGAFVSQTELEQFLKAEGAACLLSDAGKPHGLVVAYGQWRGTDRAAQQAQMPRLAVSHEHYAMLWRLANRPAPAITRAEVEVTNRFVPGPIVCYNTVGEVKGSEKPDEFVVVGAHLDSWDLATGTMDNGTGSCVVLEIGRAMAKLAKEGHRPKRTVRFVLFTGEEQGLHGSARYVEKHADEMPKTSIALVHDTGTGRVYGFGVHGNEKLKEVLEPELDTLTQMDGWRGLDLSGVFGSDHQSFHSAKVPGLAGRQDVDEYRLTHHTQTDTFDHAKGPNLVQGAQALAVTAARAANLSELLPRQAGGGTRRPKKDFEKKDAIEPKKEAEPAKKGEKVEAPAPKKKDD